MDAKPIERVKQRVQRVFGSWSRNTTLQDMRAQFDAMFAGAEPAPMERVDANGVPAAWIGAEKDGSVVLYFHGGGYQIGSMTSHLGLMGGIAGASGMRVLGFDYRLAPEHRFPAAVEDAVAVYRWLLDRATDARAIAFAGDSAGGGLAIATMLSARAEGLPLPAAAVLLSPWVDMTAPGASYRTRAALDPMTQHDKVLAMARTYLGKHGDAKHPLASPTYGDLSGLPPLLIHVGDHETILDDALAFADKARQAGTAVELTVWDEMIHHFQIFPELAETKTSLAEIGQFLKARLG